MALPQRALPLPPVEPGAAAAALDHIRRCTYRRLVALQRRPVPLYDVECLYPDRSSPLPLGDLQSARGICDSCQAAQIFRPDED